MRRSKLERKFLSHLEDGLALVASKAVASCEKLRVGAPHLLIFAHKDSVCPSPLSFVLLAASLLLSSPAGTKFFQFPAFACTTIHGAIGYPRFNVRHATTLGLSQLATAFDAARAKPSPRWLKIINFQACFSSNQLPIGNITLVLWRINSKIDTLYFIKQK